MVFAATDVVDVDIVATGATSTQREEFSIRSSDLSPLRLIVHITATGIPATFDVVADGQVIESITVGRRPGSPPSPPAARDLRAVQRPWHEVLRDGEDRRP